MDLNDIVVFTKVVETKSFTGAAEQLGLPKSTVSRKLAQLEERLGVRLVQRTTRKLALTDIGEAYYQRAARIVADLAAAEQVVTDMQATPRGRLRVTAPIDISTQYLGDIIAAFVATHPEINVELDATDRVVDLIEEGFDVGIRFGSLPESTLIARKLASFEGFLCAAPSYLARKPAPTTIEELEDHDKVLFLPMTKTSGWTLINGDQTYELGRPARFSSNNIMAVRDVVLAGAGISLLTEFMVGCEIHTGKLVRLMPEWRGRPTDINAVYPARQNIPPRLSLFLDHLTKQLNPPPWHRVVPAS
ncbi:MAG: LysR family transcriptional regulator [Myxococcales bacterium]|nr:LysR family transcriptional regulator [Myxococcales bacterium]